MKSNNDFLLADRDKAGKLLCDRLIEYENKPVVVMAIPRGGVSVAFQISQKFKFPLKLILVKKITHPDFNEMAIGAATLEDVQTYTDYPSGNKCLAQRAAIVQQRLREMENIFRPYCDWGNLSDKIVFIVDDGIATGITVKAAIEIVKNKHPVGIVIVTPVASKEAAFEILPMVTDFVALHITEKFTSVGSFFKDFKQFTDEEIVCYLNKLVS